MLIQEAFMKIETAGLAFLFLLFLVPTCSLVGADDPFWSGDNDPVWNDYGIVKCWFSKDNITWEEATVDLAELKLGEPFYIKTLIKAKKDLNIMHCVISGFGSKQDFEVIEGPSAFSEYIDIWNPVKNETHELIWKLRVKSDTNWAGGNSPINMDAQFTKNGSYTLPPFTVVNVYILDELWEGYIEDENNNENTANAGGSTPGFEITVAFLIITALALYRRKIQAKK